MNQDIKDGIRILIIIIIFFVIGVWTFLNSNKTQISGETETVFKNLE